MKRSRLTVKEQRICRMYNSQKHLSRVRGCIPPQYNLAQLRKWVLSQDIFHDLWDIYDESGFDKELNPTIDRIDIRKPYSFSNIQILPLFLNRKKSRLKQIDFIAEHL